MTGPGGTEADRAARERLAREARATATTLLDWVGTRVDGAATPRAGTTRPPQSAGPCTWCPVCALVAAVRGEQSELTAHLAEQASALLVVLRLLLQSHVHEHPASGTATPEGPAAARTAPEPEAERGPGEAGPDVPWDAPHAHFDPDPAPPGPAPDGPRVAPERPTGKRGPRPSPRHGSAGGPAAPPPAAPPPPATPTKATPTKATPAPTTPVVTGTRAPVGPAPSRSTRGVQRIPVRRRPRPC
ncbi:MAG TPA: hypothetical protein VGH76_25430 [Actinomycetospora sp.]|uniref:hypothetical protein n=1 Tax=Actinomycetospora sp. TaxID=1872135 RepID=UPI002F415388